MWRLSRLVVVVVVLVGLSAGCSVELGGGSDDPTTTLETVPLDVQTGFMNSCVDSGGSRDFCRCTLDHIEANAGTKAIVDFEAELNAGNDPELPPFAQDALDACS